MNIEKCNKKYVFREISMFSASTPIIELNCILDQTLKKN